MEILNFWLVITDRIMSDGSFKTYQSLYQMKVLEFIAHSDMEALK